MGIAFVLIFWGIAWLTAAAVGSAVLTGLTWLFLRNQHRYRKRAILAAALFPFLCVAFAAAWFIGYATINGFLFHHDPGIGDGWWTSLPNGYTVDFIDVTDEGILHPSGTDINSPTSIKGVRLLQLSREWMFGARDSGYFDRIRQESTIVDKYFEIDTKTGSVREFSSQKDLQVAALTRGSKLELQPIYAVYAKYRFNWFDYSSAAILLLVPLVGLGMLVRWVWKIRSHTPSDDNFDPGYLWRRVRSGS